MKLETDSDQLIAMAAVDYCMSRKTYMSSVGADWVIDHWKQFDDNTQFVIMRNIATELMYTRVGDTTIDAPYWKAVLQFTFDNSDELRRHTVREAVAYIEKPFPLDE